MKSKKNRFYHLLFQFIIGVILLLDGINSMFLSKPIVFYSNKYFQHQIGNGTLSLVLGLGVLVGFLLKLRDYRRNINKD
jgi:hypothetical protein